MCSGKGLLSMNSTLIAPVEYRGKSGRQLESGVQMNIALIAPKIV